MQENCKSNKHSDSLVVLIDLIPDPVVVKDRLGKIINANNAVGKFTGYKKEQLIGKNFSSLSFISEEYKQLLAENAKGRLTGSNIPPYEIRLTTKSGEIKCVKVKGKRFMNEGEPLDRAIFHDITQGDNIQNDLQQGLLKSEEKFHSITNSIKEAIIVVDEEARRLNQNLKLEVKTLG
jgi:PAS domain S-box-containing protein